LEETSREDHVVSVIPELRLVLNVEFKVVSLVSESDFSNNEEGESEPHEESTVVEWPIGYSEES
jgi:hypothetical protein